MKRVLVIGGYGNFGRFISRSLAKQRNISLIVAGRSLSKAKTLAAELNANAAVVDIHNNFAQALKTIRPNIVVHTSGPFQAQGYSVAQACIEYGAHYIDLADAREFVAGIHQLDAKAKAANILVVSGASSVPCLTSALMDYYQSAFQQIDSMDYGISTAQKTTRGVATTAAILSYTGKPFTTLIEGKRQTIYGWQSLRARKYSGLGWRLLSYCNVPDLALFPKLYPQLKTIRFYAGLELPFIHVTLWALSWLVRIRLIKNLQPIAPVLLKLSFLFDWAGSANSAFHMDLKGTDKNGTHKTLHFELIARNGDGPFIPCMPAILLAKKLADNEMPATGAMPCVGLITKEEYLNALSQLDIGWTEKWL